MSNFDKWKESLTAEGLYKLLGNAQGKPGKPKSNCNACPANPTPNSGVSSDAGRCLPSCREYFFAWAEINPLKNKPPKARQAPHYLVFDRRTKTLTDCTTIRVDALLSKLAQKAYREVECGPACPLHGRDCPKQKAKASEKSAE